MRKSDIAGFPPAQGLYRPEFEHDSCGVGFVAHIKGQRSHQIIEDADQLLCRMDHRGACGCEPNTGDGAGILTALPHEFLTRGREAKLWRRRCRRPGKFAAGIVFLPTDAAERERCKATVDDDHRRARPEARRLARRADERRRRPTSARRRARGRAAHRAARSSPPATASTGDAFERQALSDSQARQPPAARRHDRSRRQDVLHLLALDQGDHLQGHAHDRAAAAATIPDLRAPGLHEPPGDGPLAVLDEHVPALGPRPADAAS